MLTPPLTQTADTVLKRRYFQAGEGWDALSHRVCKNIAEPEEDNHKRWEVYKDFQRIIHPRFFLPNSPTLMNAVSGFNS